MTAPHPLLELRDVSLQVQGKALLAPLSLHLSAGEQVVITGPSGSGKSTLLKIISGLLSPSSGDIYLAGKAQSDHNPQWWRQQVAWCAQHPSLFGSTVRDNLIFPWQLRKKTPPDALLSDWLGQLNLAASMLDKPITALSGGEKQRVALLRHLQFTPQVLLLDEVTSSLDRHNALAVHQLINRQVAEHQVAVLQVSHNQDEMDAAPRLIRLVPVDAESKHEPT